VVFVLELLWYGQQGCAVLLMPMIQERSNKQVSVIFTTRDGEKIKLLSKSPITVYK